MTRSKPAPLTCAEALVALALERPQAERGLERPQAHGAAMGAALNHLAGCPACQGQEERARTVARLLAQGEDTPPEPSAAGTQRVLAAAAPLLARHAERARAERRRVAWALVVALLPLPLIVFANVKLLFAAHVALSGLIDPRVSLYLVGCLGAAVALLLALSYLAVPFLARRLSRARLPWFVITEDPDVHVVA